MEDRLIKLLTDMMTKEWPKEVHIVELADILYHRGLIDDTQFDEILDKFNR